MRRVVTVGSPHHRTQGTALAAAFVVDCPAACRQLVPASDLLDTAPGPPWTSVWTEADQVVDATLDAALDGSPLTAAPSISPCAGLRDRGEALLAG